MLHLLSTISLFNLYSPVVRFVGPISMYFYLYGIFPTH